MANNPNAKDNLKPFEPDDGKKKDPRINRKGRPRSFDALRELAKQIAVDVAKDNKGQEIAIPGIDDRITVVQAILLQMSRDPRRQKEFLEIAFGKVPDSTTNFNIDLSNLTDRQIERLAKGEDLYAVLASPDSG